MKDMNCFEWYRNYSWKEKLHFWWLYFWADPFNILSFMERFGEWCDRYYFEIGTAIAAILFAVGGFLFLLALGLL